MTDNQIAVIFERTMYHMTLGTVEAVRGKEEYVITLPATLSKEKVQEVLTVTMQSLTALAAEHNHSDFTPDDTWSVRLLPLRFPMLAYPVQGKLEPDNGAQAIAELAEEKSTEYTTAGVLAQMAEIFEVYASDQIATKRMLRTVKDRAANDIRAEVWTAAAKELREAAVNHFAAEAEGTLVPE